MIFNLVPLISSFLYLPWLQEFLFPLLILGIISSVPFLVRLFWR